MNCWRSLGFVDVNCVDTAIFSGRITVRDSVIVIGDGFVDFIIRQIEKAAQDNIIECSRFRAKAVVLLRTGDVLVY